MRAMKGKPRSIWISDKDWAEFREAAAFLNRSISQYLIHLHKMNISVRGIPVEISDAIPDDKVLIIPSGPVVEKPIKEAVIVNIEEPKPEKKKDPFFRPYTKQQQTRGKGGR